MLLHLDSAQGSIIIHLISKVQNIGKVSWKNRLGLIFKYSINNISNDTIKYKRMIYQLYFK